MTSQPASPVQFKVRPYAAEGGVSGIGIFAMFIAMLVAAGITGFAAHFISQWLYLIIVFPLAIGLAVGFTGAAMAKQFKVRSPAVGGAAGLFCGIAAMLILHYSDYSSLRAEMDALPAEAKAALQLPEEEFNREIATETPEDREAMKAGREALQVDSFTGFMDMQARQGVQIKRAHSSAKGGGLNLGYTGSYIYWFIEAPRYWYCAYFVLSANGLPLVKTCFHKQQKRGSMAPGSRVAVSRAVSRCSSP